MKNNFEYITIKQAKDMIEGLGLVITIPTIISWLKKHNLGHQLGKRGRWIINYKLFNEFINGHEEIKGTDDKKE